MQAYAYGGETPIYAMQRHAYTLQSILPAAPGGETEYRIPIGISNRYAGKASLMAIKTRIGPGPPPTLGVPDVFIDGLVLLIEDEESVRDAAVASLEALGVLDVVTACDGESGLQLIDEFRPCIVLVDLLMPGTDGFGVLQGIKDRPRNTRPKRVIVMSGIDDPVVERGIFQLGADRVLGKPYRLNDLRDALVG